MSLEKTYVTSWIENNKERIIKISDEIWRFAELGLIEHKSSSLLIGELNSKPIIAIMGEYDALPGLSQKKTPYKKPLEPNKPGHGCGHNIYGASGIAAAIAIRYAMEKYGLKGTIRFYGCPAEENFSGKVFMVRDGCFRDVDAAIGHHPSSMNGATLKSCLALNSAKFHFYGKAAHAGGSPDQGRSALDAVELMDVGVNFLREHIIQDARIHYIIEKGGNQPNIVPDYARSWYYVRAPEKEQVEFICNWVLDIAEGAAMMTRTELKHEFLGGLYNKIPNKVISEVIVRNMREIGLPKYTDEEIKFAEEIAKSIPSEMKIEVLRRSKRPGWEKLIDKLIDDEIPDPWGEGEVSHGSTDVAEVSWQTPTVEFSTATWILGTAGHSWQAVAQSGVGLGHKSLIFAAKTMAATVIDLMMNEDLMKKAKEEHKQRLRGREYKPPIPPEMKPPLDILEKSEG